MERRPQVSQPHGSTARQWSASCKAGPTIELVVATDKGIETLPTDELVSVRWSSTSTPGDAEEEATSTVELTDGTILPANDVQITGDHLSMTLATSVSMDQKPLAIPVKQVSAVRLKTLTPRAAEQWQEIREQKRASDVLFVAKRGGESLDYIEGVLGEITVDKIEFKFDGEPLSIDRNKVAGFFYFRRGNVAHPEPHCVLHGRNGLRVSASQVRLARECAACQIGGRLGTRLAAGRD